MTLQRLAELSGEVETRRLDQSELLCMLPLAVAATFPEGDFYRANAYQISWALTELVKRALAFDKVYVERARPTKGLPDDAIRMLLSRGDVFRMAHAGHLGRVPHWLVGHKHNRAIRWIFKLWFRFRSRRLPRWFRARRDFTLRRLASTLWLIESSDRWSDPT